MKIELRNFILQAVIIAIIIIGVTYVLYFLHFIEGPVSSVLFVVPFIMLITVIVHSFLIYSSKKGDRTFISKYIATSGFKLMLYLAAILIYVFSVGINIKLFMLLFLISYLVYTIIEIYSILKYLKK